MKTETKELLKATPDEGKMFVHRGDRIVARQLYPASQDALAAWEELDEAEALALKEQWRKEADEEKAEDGKEI
jgi:hypothetical protein